MAIRRASVEKGIGCAAVIPAGFIGLAALTDGVGPTGWLGFSELLGWAVLCWATGLGIGFLLGQLRANGRRRFAAIPLAVVAAVAFTYLINWLGLGAPMADKIAFTTTLQVVGLLAPIALVIVALAVGARQRYRP